MVSSSYTRQGLGGSTHPILQPTITHYVHVCTSIIIYIRTHTAHTHTHCTYKHLGYIIAVTTPTHHLTDDVLCSLLLFLNLGQQASNLTFLPITCIAQTIQLVCGNVRACIQHTVCSVWCVHSSLCSFCEQGINLLGLQVITASKLQPVTMTIE